MNEMSNKEFELEPIFEDTIDGCEFGGCIVDDNHVSLNGYNKIKVYNKDNLNIAAETTIDDNNLKILCCDDGNLYYKIQNYNGTHVIRAKKTNLNHKEGIATLNTDATAFAVSENFYFIGTHAQLLLGLNRKHGKNLEIPSSNIWALKMDGNYLYVGAHGMKTWNLKKKKWSKEQFVSISGTDAPHTTVVVNGTCDFIETIGNNIVIANKDKGVLKIIWQRTKEQTILELSRYNSGFDAVGVYNDLIFVAMGLSVEIYSIKNKFKEKIITLNLPRFTRVKKIFSDGRKLFIIEKDSKLIVYNIAKALDFDDEEDEISRTDSSSENNSSMGRSDSEKTQICNSDLSSSSFDELLCLLENDDISNKVYSIKEMINRSDLIVSNLISAYNNSRIYIKDYILIALGEIKNSACEDFFIENMENFDGLVGKNIALEALGKIGGEKSINTLKQYAKSKDRNQKFYATEALGKFMDSDRKIEKILKKASRNKDYGINSMAKSILDGNYDKVHWISRWFALKPTDFS